MKREKFSLSEAEIVAWLDGETPALRRANRRHDRQSLRRSWLVMVPKKVVDRVVTKGRV